MFFPSFCCPPYRLYINQEINQKTNSVQFFMSFKTCAWNTKKYIFWEISQLFSVRTMEVNGMMLFSVHFYQFNTETHPGRFLQDIQLSLTMISDKTAEDTNSQIFHWEDAAHLQMPLTLWKHIITRHLCLPVWKKSRQTRVVTEGRASLL